jgi:hypothetical protein
LVVFLLSPVDFSFSIYIQVLACAIQWPGVPEGRSWYNLFSILFFILAAIPPALCAKGASNDPFDEGGNAWPDVAFFLTGVFATSGYALSGVLLAGNIIAYQTLIMSLFGSLVLTTAVVVILRFVLGGSNEYEMN